MKFLREPLVQFLLLGAALFVVFDVMGRGGSGAGGGAGGAGNGKRIDVDAQRVALIRHGFEIDNGEPPTEAELNKAIQAYVREEILVREARAQGLDQDDSVIRRKLVQLMEFHTEPAPPTEEELQKYLAGHPEEFVTGAERRVPPLGEIRSQVAAAWMADARKAAVARMYEEYRKGYEVVVAPAGGK